MIELSRRKQEQLLGSWAAGDEVTLGPYTSTGRDILYRGHPVVRKYLGWIELVHPTYFSFNPGLTAKYFIWRQSKLKGIAYIVPVCLSHKTYRLPQWGESIEFARLPQSVEYWVRKNDIGSTLVYGVVDQKADVVARIVRYPVDYPHTLNQHT